MSAPDEARARSYSWLSPIASICVLLVITLFIYVQVQPSSTGWAGSVSAPNAQRDKGVADLAALLWGSSAIMFLAVTAAAAAVLTVTIFRALRDHVQNGPMTGILAKLGAALLVPVALAFAAASPLGNKRYVTSEILEIMLPEVMSTVGLLWAATLIAAFLVVAGACACLLDVGRGPPPGAEIDRHNELAASLNAQSRRLQSVLYAGAAVLVAGVIEVDALYHWALSMTSLSAQAKAITTSATVPTGTFFSLFLAAAYVPAALILRERGLALAQAVLPLEGPAARGQWLQSNGLAISVTSQVASLLALLGPVLAGGPLNAFAHALG